MDKLEKEWELEVRDSERKLFSQTDWLVTVAGKDEVRRRAESRVVSDESMEASSEVGESEAGEEGHVAS